mgnify:CR=1 FL=1
MAGAANALAADPQLLRAALDASRVLMLVVDHGGIFRVFNHSDERVTGLLSTAGLVGGAWLGFYLTRHMDEGLDVLDGDAAPKQDAPAAVVGRSSDGRWALGGLGLMTTTVSPTHAPTLSLVGATW